MEDFDEVTVLFSRWPETRHLSAKLKRIPFRKQDGTVDTGIETGSMIAVLEELLVIVEGMRRPPRRLAAIAARVRKGLPTIRAFHADPYTVMQSGVN